VLTRGQILRGGDLLLASDGRVVEVSAASEWVRRCARVTRGCSRASPIILATVTSRCRSGKAGCATATTTYSMRWRAVSAPSSRRAGAIRARGRAYHGSDHGAAHGGDAAHGADHSGESTAIKPHALLRLCHLVSPALPIGAYAYSQGLEYAVQAGWVHDEASALEWLQGLSSHAWARSICRSCCDLHRAWSAPDQAAIARWDAQLLASRESAELRAEERHLGRALARVLLELELSEAAELARALPRFATLFSLAAVRWDIPRV
jgi:hypothetical protein